MSKFKQILKIYDKKVWHHIILWLLGGVVLVFLTEFLLRGNLQGLKVAITRRPEILFVNYLLILILTSIIFIVKRKYMVYFMAFMSILLAGVATFFLMSARGMPLTFSDLYSIEEALVIADKYINKPLVILAIVGIIAFIVIAIFLYKLDFNTKRFNKVYFILLFAVVICFSSTVKVLQEKEIMKFIRWDITQSYKNNGFVYSAVESCIKYKRTKPDNYTDKEIASIKQRVDEAESKDTRQINTKKPNVLFVQLEAFMDPTLIKDIEFSEDPIPNFRKLSQNFTSGVADVPTTGGGTARTEFEVMTGHNIDYLTFGEIPYNTILKNKNYNSVVSTLDSQGYKTHAIHNFQGNFYNRNKAFARLGFGDFTSKEYMEGYEINERGWVKDTILTKYIKRALESTEGSDLVYTIAVQGHSSYPTNVKDYDYFPIKVKSTLEKSAANQIYYYANQLKETDNFIGELVDYVDSLEEDTIVLFYSDHMPNLKIFKQENFYLDSYQAPFTFYSNFDIEKYDIDKIESYELSSLLFKEAGLSYGPMERFNTYMKEEKDFSKLQDLVEYDVLFGKSYYIDEKEKLQKSELKMGIDDIIVNNIKLIGNKVILSGENFTESSVAFFNNKAVETQFINRNTLEVEYEDDFKNIVVKQIGRNNTELSSSNEFIYTK